MGDGGGSARDEVEDACHRGSARRVWGNSRAHAARGAQAARRPARGRLTFIHIFSGGEGRLQFCFSRAVADGVDMDVASDAETARELACEQTWALSQFAQAPLPDRRLKKGW